jgi:hypothetical protein
VQGRIPFCGTLTAKPPHRSQKLRAQFRVRDSDAAGLGVNHNVILAWDFCGRSSKDLSKQALDAVPDDSAPDLSRHRYTEAMVSDPIFTAE